VSPPEVLRRGIDASAAEPGPCLVADVGGTNARFGWAASPSSPVQHVQTLAACDFAGPAEAARAYMERLTAAGHGLATPRAFALAVATAVSGDQVTLTNSAWSFSQRALAEALSLHTLRVLNDFEALALSLPHLREGQWTPIGSASGTPGVATAAGPAGAEPPAQALAVVGPGTGLGVAGLLRCRDRWQAVPGEGGHATLAAADAFEAEVLKAAREQWAHVSAERLLSGIGLPVLHEAVAKVRGSRTEPMLAPQIVDAALAGQADAAATIRAFTGFLGGFAGNVALTLGARGGVYIGGGIVPRLSACFDAELFRLRFESKGRFDAYLQAVPTRLITDTLAALSGAAAALSD
jgi:glucokinase